MEREFPHPKLKREYLGMRLCVCHLVVGILDDFVEGRYQGLLQMEAACVAGDVGFW